ncbi:MAG TPA: glycosyltransferase family 1 protein [Bryobacteraceae bacterium]|nr:glycosyltransferase family 1 protein [Bryobacteraceae bacterium]
MRIGINALYLIPGKVGGTEIYLKSLVNALIAIDPANEYFVYVNREGAAGAVLEPADRLHVVPCSIAAEFRPGRIVWEQFVFPFVLRRDRIDVLLNAGFTGPVFCGPPAVTVFHDLQHKRHPEFFRWYDLPFWNLLLWAAAVRSRALIAVSEATAKDLDRYYPETARKTIVIPHGVDPEFFRIGQNRCGLPTEAGRYILTVSTLHPHKNIDRLLTAFNEFRKTRPDYRLVIAGMKGFAAPELEARADDLKVRDAVTFTGWISRSELYKLFAGAEAYIAPSQFEGFGMPLLEALAAGLPTACSRIEPFIGLADSSVAMFDPFSADEIRSSMETITCDAVFRRRAAEAGPRQARRFDWNHTAAETLRALEKAAA